MDHWVEYGMALVMALGGYLGKRLIDSKADTSDVKTLLEEVKHSREDLKEHVNSCDKRYEQVADSLGKINEKLNRTAEGVAEIRGKLSA